MEKKVYGYVRVSTKEQNEDRQMIALENFQVKPDRIFMDKQSGKDFQRPEYQKMIRKLREGDLLVIKSIDRLGRNYEEILEQWRILTKEMRVDVAVIDIPLLDTRKTEDNLTGTFIADLVLQILSYVAETERENIRARQAEGLEAARRRGVRFGRPRKKIPQQFCYLQELWTAGKIASREAARQLEISQDTFLRWVREGTVKGVLNDPVIGHGGNSNEQ